MPHRASHAAPSSARLRRRRLAASLVALALSAVLTVSLAGAAGAKQRASAALTSQPKVDAASGHGTALAHGVVDMAKLPILQPHAVTTARTPLLPSPDALTPAQRQVYNAKARQAAAAVPSAQPTKALTSPASPASASPSFVGGGLNPLLVKQFDGLNSTQAGGGTGAAAIATDLSYVMEGVDTALAIYRTATGALAYGPYAPASFFAPVYHAGDSFADPQLYYDTMRDRWIVLYLEVVPSGTVTYLDLAVSQSNSPTQPTPGGQYNVYQFGTDFEGTAKISAYCINETLGVDYWGLYISCIEYRNTVFVGNTIFAIDKAPLLRGAASPQTWIYNDAVKITGDVGPALEISPAIEEGVQDFEYIVATDAGYGSVSTNLTVCALSSQSNIATTQPTLRCLHNDQGTVSYSDPTPARQPGGSNIPVDFGTKQVYYKAGHLFLAWTSASGGHDGIVWEEVQPQMDLLTIPPRLYSVSVIQSATFSFFDGSQDVYTPSIVGTDEDDIVLVFNGSASSGSSPGYPGVYYTGRKATDPDQLMGQVQSGSPAQAISGTHTTTAPWGKYSACATSLNSVTRGGVWCVVEYAGATADPGWNTRLFNLRAE